MLRVAEIVLLVVGIVLLVEGLAIWVSNLLAIVTQTAADVAGEHPLFPSLLKEFSTHGHYFLQYTPHVVIGTAIFALSRRLRKQRKLKHAKSTQDSVR